MRLSALVLAVGGLSAWMGSAALAQERDFTFDVPGAPEAVAEALKNASLTREGVRSKTDSAQDLFASAQADYARLLGVLYDQGYYAGTISIRLNGREAANIEPMDAPAQIGTVLITVVPGDRFVFARAAIGPVAPESQLPSGYREGETARSGTILDAAAAGVRGWREQGHAKARIAGQQITADHRRNTVSSDIRLTPGPEVHFGDLHVSGNERLRTKRLIEIAGYPTGRKFSPERLEEVRNRLRRTGIFSSVTLTEAEMLRSGGLLDAELLVVEEKRRRMGAGIEIGSTDGLTLSGFWLHRNLRGGGERMRVDGEISGIGGTTGGTDYSLGVRIDRPASFTPDTSAFILADVSHDEEEYYTQDGFGFGFGLSHVLNERLSGETAIKYEWARVEEAQGDFRRIYRLISFPSNLLWDNRDVPADATQGYYGNLKVTPFYGLGDTGSGVWLMGDMRTYRGFGENDRVVLAGRFQIGGVFGPSLNETPRDYLFYSGGGGTVRGQPYQSLGVRRHATPRDSATGLEFTTGGTRFLGFSGEVRTSVTESIGVVAFYDAGFVGGGDTFSDDGDWHAGAGLGLRYKTPIGPIRLDIAGPVSGPTGDGAQIYLGIGQAF